jgi:phage terminase large subunit-like protein
MPTSNPALSAASINCLPAAQRTAFLESLSADEAAFLERDWRFWARPEQLPPEGAWRIWLFLGGRGAGKTRAGAEWVRDGVREGRMRRVALLGATYADVRDVMILGESGLLPLSRGEGVAFEPSKRRLTWPNGAVAHVFTAEEPDGLRGHQFDGALCDALEGAFGLGALRVAVTKAS